MDAKPMVAGNWFRLCYLYLRPVVREITAPDNIALTTAPTTPHWPLATGHWLLSMPPLASVNWNETKPAALHCARA